jgi:hypothetical protein
MVVYLVRSYRTYARIRSLTTGTFNLVVKDRIAFRLSGAPSVQANPHECESDCPRNPLNISSARKPVNLHIPRDFHTRKPPEGDAGSTFQSLQSFTFKP